MKYRRLLAEMLQARRDGDEPFEDQLLDRMDSVWYALTAEEHRLTKELSGRLASGALSEDEFIASELGQTPMATRDWENPTSSPIHRLIVTTQGSPDSSAPLGLALLRGREFARGRILKQSADSLSMPWTLTPGVKYVTGFVVDAAASNSQSGQEQPA